MGHCPKIWIASRVSVGYFQKGIFGWAEGGLVIRVNTSKVHQLCVVKWIRPGLFLGFLRSVFSTRSLQKPKENPGLLSGKMIFF
jgi:hypothetical protein